MERNNDELNDTAGVPEDRGVADAPPPALPAADEVQRVETERVGDARQSGGRLDQETPGGFSFRYASFGSDGIRSFSSSQQQFPMQKPPTAAAWVCLALAWLFLGSSVPFTVFLGIPFALASLLLATVCLTRGGLFTGLAVLALGTAGSLVVYLVGLFRFVAHWS